jgi:guanine deaminase
VELRYEDDAIVAIDEAGRFSSIEPATAAIARGPGGVVRRLDGLMVPGFVDTHLHFPQTRVVGSATGTLLDWLGSTVFPEEARFHDAAYARTVASEFADACLANGTTAVGAYSSSDPGATRTLIDVLSGAGLRGLVGMALMDQLCPPELALPADRALPACRELAAYAPQASEGRVAFAITPRFALSCTPKLMEGAAALARELDLFVQTHVSENPREGEETLAMHPIANDYLGVYEKLGLIGDKTILAHAIHFSPDEWERVARLGARIAHCPDSNFFLGSGVMRLRGATSRGIPVGLGSDVAAGRSFSMRRAIAYAHDASFLSGAGATPEELFTMATLGGARVLGLDGVVGAIEPGLHADFAVLRLPPGAEGRAGALRAATFAADVAPVTHTFLSGREVFRQAPD